MKKLNAMGCLLAAAVWLLVALGLAFSYRYLLSPAAKAAVEGPAELSLAQWQALAEREPIQPITFARGSSELNDTAEQFLAQLAERMRKRPELYLRILGAARADGDAQANTQLACARAERVAQRLRSHGVYGRRIQNAVSEPMAQAEAQSVSFILGTPD